MINTIHVLILIVKIVGRQNIAFNLNLTTIILFLVLLLLLGLLYNIIIKILIIC
jgi:hypothetical protein